MKLNVPKSFHMMKRLNQNHGLVMRAIVGIIAYCGTVIATQKPALGVELAGRFWTENDFKLGARRGAWYSRRSWLKLDVSNDDYFDPTEGMTDTQLDALERFIDRRKPFLEPIEAATDLAFIAARRLNNNSDPARRTANIAAFKLASDELLTYQPDHHPPALNPQETRNGDFPIADAKRALTDFADLFPPDQIPWFLVSGTFLGLIRENGFLTHDYDIDLGIFEDQVDIAQIRAKILACDTFVVKKYDHHQSNLFKPDVVATDPDIPYILKIVHSSGVHIDLFIHYRDTTTNPAIYWHGSSLHRWENSAFDLTSYLFYDLTVLGPTDADAYLTENYGDWRTPMTEFNCTTDTPNLALVEHPVAVVIFLKRYVIAKTFDPDQAARLRTELIANGFLNQSSQGYLEFSGDLFSQ